MTNFIPSTALATFALRLFAAFLCGLILGIERKAHQHTVGLRTLILISTSSALLGYISVTVPLSLTKLVAGHSSDPARLAAAVVTGIGFLGAGAILRWGINIRGITTAAVIWSASALGLACGMGEVFFTLLTLVLITASLLIFSKVEHKFFPASKSKILTVIFRGEVNLAAVKKALAQSSLIEHDLNIEQSITEDETTLLFWVKAPKTFDLDKLTSSLKASGNLIKISIKGE